MFLYQIYFPYSLRVFLITINDWMLLLVATISHIEIEAADVVTQLRVFLSKTIFELFVALTVQPGEIVVVFQAMLSFP